MSNVLGTLFGEIADAIRGKTGDTATMKPVDFPAAIAAIETGGGAGDGSGYQFKSGSIKPASGSAKGYRFNVNFGFQPDFIFAFANGQFARQTQTARAYFGFSAAATAAFGWSSPYNRALTEGTNDWMYDSNSQPIETTNTYTPIYNADPTGFNVGYKPQTSGYYTIWAFKFPL